MPLKEEDAAEVSEEDIRFSRTNDSVSFSVLSRSGLARFVFRYYDIFSSNINIPLLGLLRIVMISSEQV
jgi:hypothetical protein